MPQRRKARTKKSAPVGPFDLSARQLPGGSEMDAMATGIALQRARGEGYGMAAKLANKNTVADATKQQPWILGDVKTGLLRSQNAPQLFDAFPNEMTEIFTHVNNPGNITAQEFARGHAWKQVLNIDKNQPLTGSFEDLGKHYVKLREDVFLAHRPDRPEVKVNPVRGALGLNALTFDYYTPRRVRTATDTPAKLRTTPIVINTLW